MKVIGTLFILAFVLFLLSVFFFVIWRYKKEVKYLKVGGVGFVLTFVVGILLLFKFVNKSYNKISDSLKPRSGIEIYKALLGEPENDCLEVVFSKDQIVPKLDVAILLYCNTCIDETERLLKNHQFNIDTVVDFITDVLSEKPEWLNKIDLGDTVIVHKTVVEEGKNWQNIYASLDYSNVLIEDILD